MPTHIQQLLRLGAGMQPALAAMKLLDQCDVFQRGQVDA
jgi:hypothetical protein